MTSPAAVERGKRISNQRRLRNLTQDDLAAKMREALGNKTSKDSVSRWERGEAAPDSENLAALAALLGCSEGYIMRGEESRPDEPRRCERERCAHRGGRVRRGAEAQALTITERSA